MMQIDPRAVKRAGLLWVIALVMFALPHPTMVGIWDPVFHRVGFLVVAPLVIAGLSLLLPVKDGTYDRSVVLRSDSRLHRRRSAWKAIGGCVFLALFVVFMLLAVNDEATWRTNVVGGIAVVGLLGLAVYFFLRMKRVE